MDRGSQKPWKLSLIINVFNDDLLPWHDVNENYVYKNVLLEKFDDDYMTIKKLFYSTTKNQGLTVCIYIFS